MVLIVLRTSWMREKSKNCAGEKGGSMPTHGRMRTRNKSAVEKFRYPGDEVSLLGCVGKVHLGDQLILPLAPPFLPSSNRPLYCYHI